jgi:formate/nitrite transporter
MDMFLLDAYSPQEIAKKVEGVGVKKASLPFLPMFVLAILAGAFISLGAVFFVVVTTGNDFGGGVSRLLGGMAFSLGLILVVVAGAELFTGNNLMVMAWASRKINTGRMIKSWIVVYLGNLLGALGTVALVAGAGTTGLMDHGVGDAFARIAMGKVSLPFMEAFFRGILCNALVCLGVWLALAGRSVMDKTVPMGMAASGFTGPDLYGLFSNLIPVTLGNIFGGSVMVAGIYYAIFIRGLKASDS